MKLTDEQQAVVTDVIAGNNVLMTGPAGTGKTTTIREICKVANAHSWTYGVTAMTGCAAVLIHGRTLHSFLGIGVAGQSSEMLAISTRKKKPHVFERLLTLRLLIIDEISMMNAEMFTKISRYLSHIRMDDAPFGGVQVLLCGDFAQLPPIEGGFCFESKEWDRATIHKHILTKLFRQTTDVDFQHVLMRLRVGQCNDKDLVRLQKCMCTEFPNGIEPTKLYPLNRDVNRINQEAYQKIKRSASKIHTYQTRLRTKIPLKLINIPEELELCIGAQVMVIWNLSETIVNGTRGVVVDLHPTAVDIHTVSQGVVRIPMTEISLSEESKKDTVVFMPLRLGYALSIHKSQGMTLDAVEMDLGTNIFEYGQAYVALSRARSLQSIRIMDVHPKSFRIHPKVKDFYDQ